MKNITNKPYYNARLANAKMKLADEIAYKEKILKEEKEKEQLIRIERERKNSFSNVVSKRLESRKRLIERRERFDDNLALLAAKIAYVAAPVDNKEVLSENASFITDYPDNFISLYENVKDLFATNFEIKRTLGDYYSRSSELNFGNMIGVTAAAVNAAASVDLIRKPVDVEDNGISFTVTDTIDSLLYFGDTAAGLEKDSRYELVQEFVNYTASEVERRVISACKIEAERADKIAFLNEMAVDNPYAYTAHKNIVNQTKTTTLLNEVTMTVFAINHDKGNVSEESLMSEGIMQYTLMETLNTLGLMSESVEDLKKICKETRQKYRKKNYKR